MTPALQAVLLGRRTANLLQNAIWAGAGSNVAPTSWTLNANTMAPAASIYGTDSTAIVFTGAASRSIIFQSSIPVASNSVYTASVVVEANPGAITLQELLDVANRPAGALTTYPQGGTMVPVAGQTIYAVVTVSTTAGTVDFRAGVGCQNNSTGSATLSRPIFTVGTRGVV